MFCVLHAVSRPARIPNPIVRLGFHLLRDRERVAFLDSTKRRMLTFTELALADEDPDCAIRDAATTVTARRMHGTRAAHEALAHRIRRR